MKSMPDINIFKPKVMKKQANTQQAASDTQSLNDTQRMGMQQYGLTRDDVQAINFSDETLLGMRVLLDQNRVNNTQEAFVTLRGLNGSQILGITQYQMTREDVLEAEYGAHTLSGITNLVQQNPSIGFAQAAEMLRGLNAYQVEGVVRFNLTTNEVRTQNYGLHTNDAINRLRGFRRVRSFQRALQLVGGLNAVQTRGVVDFRLRREDVLTPNFGRHTLDGIQELLDNRRVNDYREGFLMLRELNPTQVTGITFYQLRRNQVLAPQFGEHTLRGIMALRLNTNENLTFREAHQRIENLNRPQTEGITRFGLSRAQVEEVNYGENILNVMYALNRINTNATGESIYNYAMQMPEYQVRAISTFHFTTEQLGIAMENNEFVQLDSDAQEILSGSTIEVVAQLMEDNMNREEALEVASSLNTSQKLGILDFGLTLDQVRNPIFDNAEETLEALITELSYEENDFELPLSPEDKNRSRAIMAKMILEDVLGATTSVSINNQADVASWPEASDLTETNNLILNENDTVEFLTYALPRDFLGIFDGLNIVTTEEKKNDTEELTETNSIEEEILKATLAFTGVASAQPTNESALDAAKDLQQRSMSAFTIPNSPDAIHKGNRKRSYSSDSSEDRKPAAQKSNQQHKSLPKSKGKKL
jgi:hypothetical protein